METCHVEFVKDVQMDENMIVKNAQFGDLKQVHFGVVIVNLHIFLK